MDYTNLNFKHILVILNRKDLRSQLIDFIEFNQLDIKVKYTNSYFEAAKYIENEKAEPINHIIMGFQGQGQKFIDFIEHITQQSFYFEGFLLELEDNKTLHTIFLRENDGK